MKEQISEIDILSQLKNFIGSENIYKNTLGLLYTDGLKYIADSCGAYWLIDLVESYQKEVSEMCPFQLWTIKVNPDKSAVVTLQDDSNCPIVVQQDIPYTDFPIKELKLYCCNNTLLLPSEY